MKIHIGTFTGRQFSVNVASQNSIYELKVKVYQQSQIDPESQVLLHGERTLDDARSCGFYGLRDGSQLQLVLQMRGGNRISVQQPDNVRFKMVEQILHGLDASSALQLLALLDDDDETVAAAVLEEPRSRSSSISSMELVQLLRTNEDFKNILSAACSRAPSARKTRATPPKKITPPKKTKNTCHKCHKKLGIASLFNCKCGHSFCSVHRYSDRHDCRFDFKEAGRAAIAKNNPSLKNNKVVKL